MESVQSLLYPFTWCHVFIPILPNNLWELVESPTPIICGVLSKDIVKQYKIENVSKRVFILSSNNRFNNNIVFFL